MEELETTNLVDGDDTSADIETNDTEVENEVQETEPQLDDEGNPIEDHAEVEEEEFEEVERDGKKYKIPAALKSELLMQADYTRKTQELAETRKAFEAERQAAQQADATEMSARANLALIERQLGDYSKVDWNAWHDSDPFEAQKAFSQFQLLKDAKVQTTQYLEHVQQERTVREQRETAKRLDEGAAELAKAIPDWSPQKAAQLLDAGQKHFGFSRDELDGIDNPKVVIALNAAVKWIEHEAKTKAAANKAKSQQFQPAPTLKGTTARTPIRADTNDFAAFEKYAESKLKA